MRYLVTGATGFIGSNIAKALEKAGNEVVVADLDTSRKSANLAGFKGKIIEADLSEPDFWRGLTETFDAVSHQASCTDTTVTDEVYMMKHNYKSFLYLMDWAQKNSVPVIYASSAAVYGNAPTPQKLGRNENQLNIYGRSKLAMDKLARKIISSRRLPKLIGLRYFNVYGPGEAHKGKMASMVYKLAQQIKNGKRPRIFFDGEQQRDQIYIDDVVRANILACEAQPKASGIYNVGSGSASSFNEIIRELNNVLCTNLDPDYFGNPYSFYQNHTLADISETEKSLGYKPEFSLAKGIMDYYESGELIGS